MTGIETDMDTVLEALDLYAHYKRRESKHRSLTGPQYAERRASLRKEAAWAEDMISDFKTGNRTIWRYER